MNNTMHNNLVAGKFINDFVTPDFDKTIIAELFKARFQWKTFGLSAGRVYRIIQPGNDLGCHLFRGVFKEVRRSFPARLLQPMSNSSSMNTEQGFHFGMRNNIACSGFAA